MTIERRCICGELVTQREHFEDLWFDSVGGVAGADGHPHLPAMKIELTLTSFKVVKPEIIGIKSNTIFVFLEGRLIPGRCYINGFFYPNSKYDPMMWWDSRVTVGYKSMMSKQAVYWCYPKCEESK